MGPRGSRGSPGAVENSGDVVGVTDDVKDAHPAAALAADGHVEGEDSGEQVGPAETARGGGGHGGVAVVRRTGASEGKVEGELLSGRGDPRWWKDASAKVVAICEHTEVPRRVNMRGRHKGAQAGEEPVWRHVGVGGPAAPGALKRTRTRPSGSATTASCAKGGRSIAHAAHPSAPRHRAVQAMSPVAAGPASHGMTGVLRPESPRRPHHRVTATRW